MASVFQDVFHHFEEVGFAWFLATEHFLGDVQISSKMSSPPPVVGFVCFSAVQNPEFFPRRYIVKTLACFLVI